MFKIQMPQEVPADDDYYVLRATLHRHIVDTIETDGSPVEQWDLQTFREYVSHKLRLYIDEHSTPINRSGFDQLVDDILNELIGLGPIEALLGDDNVSDILVNGPHKIFVDRGGKLEPTGLRFLDDDHVLRVIRRILAPLGRRIDGSEPMVDARLPDGSRINAIIPPVALDGPCLSIRKFRADPLRSGDLLSYGTLNESILQFLQAVVAARSNILISGSSGAGKTTLLNVLSQEIHATERLVSIEDAAELQLGHPHVVRLETRPANTEGIGEITARQLVRNALRMRPDRIILGEVRGIEVLDLLQAMGTGHDGSMGTIHANNPRDALGRIEMLAGFSGFNGSESTLRELVANAVDLIIHVTRMTDGRRRITKIAELNGVSDTHYVMQELFCYDAETDQFISNQLKPQNFRVRRGLGLQATRTGRN